MALKENKTIMIFSAYYPPHVGGVERYVHEMAKNLSKLGHRVVIVTSDIDAKPGKEISDGIILFRLPVYNIIENRYPVPKMLKSRYLLKEIRKINADLYIANMRFYPVTLLGGIIAKKNNKPFYIIEHATGHLSVNNRFFDKLGEIYEHLFSNLVRRYTSRYYGVSGAVCKWLEHFGIEADGVVYNGIEPEIRITKNINIREKYSIPNEGFIFVYAGRLIHEKGVLELCESFEQLNIKNSNTYLFIAGDGKLLNNLKAKYDKDGTNIFLTGQVEHDFILNLLETANSVVMPSYYPEGLPTLILEAGLMKCAVISTSAGGIKEVIENNVTGILIEPKNSDNLFDAMEKLLKDPRLCIQLSQKLNEKVLSEFTWDKIIEKFLSEL